MGKKYRLGEDIIRQDGTRVYTVEKIVDEIFGNPVTKIIFRGTKKECKKELERIEKENE